MWRAIFKDNSVLEEFNNFGKEILFRNVMDRVDELTTFSIVLSNSKIFTVRLKDGRFTVKTGKNEDHFYGFDIEKFDVREFENVRPIYFVRETVDFLIGAGPGSKTSPPRVNFTACGFQANYRGINIKRYLAIYPDGKYVIRDK